MKQKKHIEKRMLSIILTLAMVIGLMPQMSLTVRAEDATTISGNDVALSTVEYELTSDNILTSQPHIHDDITFTPWTQTDSLPSEGGSYYLTNNVTINNTWVVSSNINLCLNGYGIIKKGNEDDNSGGDKTGGVILLMDSSSLNIFDNESDKTHYITLDKWRGTSVDDSGSETEVTNGTGVVKVIGGFITGGHRNRWDGGAVLTYDKVRFTMSGGTILGNYAKQGGAIMGKFGNTNIVLKDVTIKYNKSSLNGGGVQNYVSKLTIDGCSITDNYCSNTYTTSGLGGGGVHFESGTITLIGDTFIDNNTTVGYEDNLYLRKNQKLAVDTLSEGTNIGITMQNVGVFTNSTNTNNNKINNFTSDKASYAVGKNKSGQLYLGNKCTVSFQTGQHGKAPASQMVAYGSIIDKPDDPIAEGYALEGWYKEAEYTNKWDFNNDTVTADTILYAKWESAATAPTISEQPQSLDLIYGYSDGGNLSVTAEAATDTTYGDLTYQWYSNTTDSTEGGNAISDATSTSYTIPTGENAGTTYYYCVVTATRSDNGQTAAVASNTAKVTIAPKSSDNEDVITEKNNEILTYTGEPVKPTIIIKDGNKTLVEGSDYIITYAGVTPTEYPGEGGDGGKAPTNAGKYEAVITFKDNYSGSKKVEFDISKVVPTIAPDPTVSAITYGQKLSDSTITGSEAKDGSDKKVAGTYTWEDDTVKPTVADSEKTEYTVVFTPDDADNYESVNVKVKVKVAKYKENKDNLNNNQKPTAIEGLIYNGEDQILVNPPENLPDGYTKVQYRLSDEDEWSDELPTGKNVGTYEVQFKYVADENHIDFEGDTIENPISPKPSTDEDVITKQKEDETLTYTGEPVKPTIVITDGTDENKKELVEGTDYTITYEGVAPTVYPGEGEDEGEAPTNAGTYKAVITFKDNYTGTKEIEFTIDKGKEESPDAESFTTTIAKDTGSASGKIEGFDKDKTYQYSEDGGKTWIDVPKGATSIDVKAGTYKIRLAGDDNHEPGDSVEVTVGVKSVTGVKADVDNVTFTKAGETAQLNVSVTPSDAANKKVTFTSSDPKVATVDKNGKITAVANGTATITITTEDGAKTATVKVTVSIPNADGQTAVSTPEEKAALSLNAGFKVSQTGSKITVKWGRVKEADGYDVYVTYCGQSFANKMPAKTVKTNNILKAKITRINGKKINLKKNFKVYIAAYKMVDGKKERIAKTITGHVVGRKNTKYSNARKIKITSKTKLTIGQGKTSRIEAKTVLVTKGKKQLSDAHAKEFRYASSNKAVATVDKNGKVTGVAKGTCIIYVYARNGYARKVSVTVK